MKFAKFARSLSPDGGIIYEYGDEHWLASDSVFMKIPAGVRSVTARDIVKMPEVFGKIIKQECYREYAHLTKAVMPNPAGAFKDCVRIYTSKDKTMNIPISNDAWALIEADDVPEIKYSYDMGADSVNVEALLINSVDECGNEYIAGVIFACDYEEGDEDCGND